ncbi:10817_t:CDS:2 [Funneliformis geosporum]|uniref:19257_t:CDS:1 n=1 Tax=Funneliformis geosporum TaxID=1117311 RepID=A0A9W4SJB8_9GLOM|nr:19257_t:CDS:2 [Funneliformis geosporum]CAI2171541.1 10817_t:CDS:2 [Funneliformis geosporum]
MISVLFANVFIVIPITIVLFIQDLGSIFSNKEPVDPKIILITGASSGIGASLAKEYAKPGVILGLLARNEENFDDKYPIDLFFANAAQIATTRDNFGKEEWEDSYKPYIDVNYTGNIASIMTVYKRMKLRRRGQIAITSSIAGWFNTPITAFYNSMKAALNSFARDLHYIAKPYNVHVSLIAPGLINTEMTIHFQNNNPRLFASSDKLAKIIKHQLSHNVFQICWPYIQGLITFTISSYPIRIQLLLSNYLGNKSKRNEYLCIQKLKETQQTCPECEENISIEEFEDLNLAWEKAPFRIHIEKISEPEPTTQNIQYGQNGNNLKGEFYIVLLNGTKLQFSLENIKNVLSLKEAIYKQTNIEIDKQKLIYKGVELQTYSTHGKIPRELPEYSIVAECHIQLIVLLYSISKELSINALTFDLFWEYPRDKRRDFLDGTCLIYTDTGSNSHIFDYKRKTLVDIPSMDHSGDIVNDAARRGHHRITANLAEMPSNVTKLYFVLSSWSSPNIGCFPNPSFKMYDPSNPKVQLCSYSISSAASSRAVIMCVVSKNNDGYWNVFEVGKLSDGNARNYAPINNTIMNMDQFFS